MNAFLLWLRRAILCGVVLIIVLSPTQHGIRLFGRVSLSIVDPLIWLACAAWVLWRTFQGRWRDIPLPPMFAVLFIIPAGVSLHGGGDALAGVGDLFQWVEYFIVAYVLFCGVIDDCRRLRQILMASAVVAALVIGLALVQYLQPSVASLEVKGAFGNRNVLGGYLALVLPLMAGVAMCWRDWRVRTVLIVFIAMGLVVNLSGGTLIGVVVALGVMGALQSSRTLLVTAILLMTGMVVFAAILPRENGRILAESIQLYDEDSVQVSRRYTEWQAAAKMAAENPWRGVGLGRYQSNIGRYYGTLPDLTGPTEPDTQNLYLVTASTTGLPGLACLIGLLLGFIGLSVKALFQHGDGMARGVALGACGALLAYSINAMWSPLLVRGLGVPLAIVMALAGALTRLAGNEGASASGRPANADE